MSEKRPKTSQNIKNDQKCPKRPKNALNFCPSVPTQQTVENQKGKRKVDQQKSRKVKKSKTKQVKQKNSRTVEQSSSKKIEKQKTRAVDLQKCTTIEQ